MRSKAGPLQIFLAFLRTGATTFGGMWAATQKLEKDLVVRTGWLKKEELRASLVLATLIPAPKFLSLGGLVGFRMGRWPGSFCATVGLILPASVLVLAGTVLVGPELLGGPLAPLNRAISIAVVGLLFGNAYRQGRDSKVSRRDQLVGLALTVAIFAAILAGIPLIAAAFVGFVLGAVLIREEKKPAARQAGAR